MSVTIEVSPNILQWVQSQIPPTMISEIDTLKKWLSGEELPTPSKISKLSQKIHIPFGYFFLKMPPQEEFPLAKCRTINSSGIQSVSREAIDTLNAMTSVKDWMSEYKIRAGFEPLSFVGKFAENADLSIIVKVVEDIRLVLSVDEDWSIGSKDEIAAFKFMREKISEAGILVMQSSIVGKSTRRKLSVKEFRAFTLIDKYAPLIFINSNDTNAAKIFSLLHELAHIWLGRENFFNDNYFEANNSRVEQICNAVAAEILVPRKLFIEKWRKLTTNSNDKLVILAGNFKCSLLTIARRAMDLKFIDEKLYTQIAGKAKREAENIPSKNKKAGGDIYNTLKLRWDKRFIAALDSSTKSGDTQFIEAYRLTGLKGETFHRLTDSFNKGR